MYPFVGKLVAALLTYILRDPKTVAKPETKSAAAVNATVDGICGRPASAPPAPMPSPVCPCCGNVMMLIGTLPRKSQEWGNGIREACSVSC